VPAPVRLAALGAVAVVVVLNQTGLVAVRLPQNARQVPQTVYLRGPIRSNAQFGFEMGTGVRTLVTAMAPYLLLASLVLFPPGLMQVLAAGLAFGLTRGMVPVLWNLTADPSTVTARRQWDVLFGRWRAVVAWTALLICGTGALLVAV
jgi:hypothetical protein